MDILRSRELHDRILSYFSPISLIALKQTNKELERFPSLQKPIVMKLFRRNLSHLLSSCGYSELSRVSADGYESVLRPGGCILSGSIVLQALLGEEWVGSDVDMYVTASDVLRVRRKLFRKMGYQYSMWPKDKEKPNQFNGGLEYFSAHVGSLIESLEMWDSTEVKAEAWLGAALPAYYDGHGPGSAEPRRIPGQSASALQLILLKESVVAAEEAVHTFDLDVVQSTWDGTTLHILHPDAVAGRTAHVSDYVNAMTTAFGSVSDPSDDKFLRLRELERRGLVVLNRGVGAWRPGEYKFALKRVFRTLFRRLQKYSLRGFSIVAKKVWSAAKLAEVVRWVEGVEPDDDSDTEAEGDLLREQY